MEWGVEVRGERGVFFRERNITRVRLMMAILCGWWLEILWDGMEGLGGRVPAKSFSKVVEDRPVHVYEG